MDSAKPETIIGNARIVLADRVIDRGWIAFADGRVAEYGEGVAPSRAVEIADARTPARPSTSSAPSSRQTRSESSTVVIPQVVS